MRKSGNTVKFSLNLNTKESLLLTGCSGRGDSIIFPWSELRTRYLFQTKVSVMQAIERAVNIARVRLNANLFFRLVFRSLLVGLGFAVLAWSVPKIWPLENWLPGVTAGSWCWGSLLTGITLGLAYSLFSLWRQRTGQLDAAVEVDRRFGLKERLSSALALDEQAVGSPVGQALIADAEGRAARIDVRDQFPIRLEYRLAWLLAPIAAIVALGFVPDARTPEKVPVTPVVNETKPIEVAVEVAKKSLQERAKQLEEQGLKEAAADLQTLAKKFDSLPAGESDLKKDALLKLNDVRDELDKQRSALGNVEALKQNLAKLSEVSQGPADKLNKAITEGDFNEAKKLVEELARKLKSGELNEQERKQLAEQLQKMADVADKLAKEHEQAKRDLEEQIRQAQAEGDLKKAADLQKKLEKREAVDRQMGQLKKAAENLQKAGKAVEPKPNKGQQTAKGQPNKGEPSKQGNEQKENSGDSQSGESKDGKESGDSQQQMQEAQKALEDLAEQIEQMEIDDQMQQQLQDLEQDLQECKDGINGCQNPGDKPGGKKSKKGDFQKGEGRGHGEREQQEGETGEYKSKVKGAIQKGETVKTGNADGNNLPGSSAAEARELIKSEMSRQSDPLEDQQLPRSQREQAKEYFEKLRGG